MKIAYDHIADALYITLTEKTPVDNVEIDKDIASCDLDKDGHIVGIEILNASKTVSDCLRVEIENYTTLAEEMQKMKPEKQETTA